MDPIGGISITDDDFLVVSLKLPKGVGAEAKMSFGAERCVCACGQGSQGAVDLAQSQSRCVCRAVSARKKVVPAWSDALAGP